MQNLIFPKIQKFLDLELLFPNAWNQRKNVRFWWLTRRWIPYILNFLTRCSTLSQFCFPLIYSRKKLDNPLNSSHMCGSRYPGATQLTRMPLGASSTASVLVSPRSAVLLMLYTPSAGKGSYAPMDATKQMLLPSTNRKGVFTGEAKLWKCVSKLFLVDVNLHQQDDVEMKWATKS